MAKDVFAATEGSGENIVVDKIGTDNYQVIANVWGAYGTANKVDAAVDKGLPVQIGVATSGGCTPYKNIDVDESEDQVKGAAGQLYWIHAMNTTAAVIYLKVYNEVGASVTVGTTVPDLTFPLPTQGDTNGAGFTIAFPSPIAMGTGITIACTGALADNDATAIGANACVVNLGYA